MIDIKIIEMKIKMFKSSPERAEMIVGEKYHNGVHDILQRKRKIIGEDGNLMTSDYLPNNRIVDNQYGKIVDQKRNYLLGQPFIVRSENRNYKQLLKQIFGRKFHRLLKNIGEDAINMGLGWLFIYYNDKGELTFRRIKTYEIIPIWSDSEKTELDYAIRLYETTVYEQGHEKTVEKVEVFAKEGIYRYVLEGTRLTPAEDEYSSYLYENNGKSYNWSRIPLIPFRCNAKEIPLIRKVKPLQDSLNLILSNFQNQIEQDPNNSIFVLVNYDGEKLADFRKQLTDYGVIKVVSQEGASGDVKTLQVEINAENYRSIMEMFKKAIMENAKGYDANDGRMSNNPNQLNIKSVYSEIDLDANEMETELQASLIDLMWFVDMHLFNYGRGNFEEEEVTVIFNRDMPIFEAESIENIRKSVGILAAETLISQHPWVDDPMIELELLKKEQVDQLG